MEEMVDLEIGGYRFMDPVLLESALTHSSYLHEHPEENAHDFERLEFLGAHQLRVPRCEILLPSSGAKGTIRAGNFSQIAHVLQSGGDEGMWTFDRYQRWIEQVPDWVRPTQTAPSFAPAANPTSATPMHSKPAAPKSAQTKPAPPSSPRSWWLSR